MPHDFAKGAKVSWNWGTGTGEAEIVERFERRVSRTINGKRITRAGTRDNPAYLLRQSDGNTVLKRGTELRET